MILNGVLVKLGNNFPYLKSGKIIRIWTKRMWNYSLISRVHHFNTHINLFTYNYSRIPLSGHPYRTDTSLYIKSFASFPLSCFPNCFWTLFLDNSLPTSYSNEVLLLHFFATDTCDYNERIIGPVHSNALSFENAYISMPLRLQSTLIRWAFHRKRIDFEHALESGSKRKRIHIVLVSTVENASK